MNLRFQSQSSAARRARGWTVLEIVVATGVGSVVLAAVASLSLFGSRSSASLLNYADLDGNSRYALDLMSRDTRQATAVLAIQTNLPVKYITLTNSDRHVQVKMTWDSNAGTVVYEKTGQAPLTVLTGCDRFDFSLYQRTPLITRTNILFFPSTNNLGQLDLSFCKLISLSWKCSRSLLAQKVNTETVQEAQITLRNKR